MSYKLKFLPSAWKEWCKLSPEIKSQFKKQLQRRLETPHIDSARIRGYKNYYKIKLRYVGYRLVYKAEDNDITVYVIRIGRRNTIYKILEKRISRLGHL